MNVSDAPASKTLTPFALIPPARPKLPLFTVALFTTPAIVSTATGPRLPVQRTAASMMLRGRARSLKSGEDDWLIQAPAEGVMHSLGESADEFGAKLMPPWKPAMTGDR